MEQYILDNGISSRTTKKGMESRSGQMAQSTQAYGPLEKQAEKEGSFWQMEMYMKVNGRKTRHMDLVFITMLMEQSTRVSGSTTSRKASGRKNGLINQSLQGSIKMGKNMESGNSFGLMVLLMKESGTKTRCTEAGNFCGRMGVFMRVST